MYKNLKTNLPKEVMAFPDFPFEEEIAQSFLTHKQVLEYLEKYADHFQLAKNIHFDTKVESISITEKGYTVVTKCLNTNKTSEREFDAVMVCNGHYSVPAYPTIPDQDKFTGKIVHSHNYRDPEMFRGENVVVLGAAASGTDIAMELARYANQVYLSHNMPSFLTSKMPKNVAQIRGLATCIGPSAFLLTDGSRVQCDSVIYATGYHYNFPFLTEDCGITVGNNQVNPLYKHLININHPTMAFIGIPFQVCPFPQFDLQVRYFVKTLTGEAALPTQADMEADLEKEKQWRKNELGFREKDLHKFGDHQWAYNNELAALAGEPPLNQVVEDLYREVWSRRRANLPEYKQDNFALVDNGNSFKEVIRDSSASEKHL